MLDSDIQQGLDIFEIKHRQERFGFNVLTPKKGKAADAFPAPVQQPAGDHPAGCQRDHGSIERPYRRAGIFGVVLVNAVIGISRKRVLNSLSPAGEDDDHRGSVIRSGRWRAWQQQN